MKLSIIIPVYNEEDNLRGVVEKILTDCSFRPLELVIVDDCSTDQSRQIAEQIQKDLTSEAVDVLTDQSAENLGKGAAIHRALELASGDIIVINDADFEYDPKDIEKLVTPIVNDNADVVYGSRFKKDSPQVHRTFHYLVNRFLTLLSNALSGLYLTDMETCYKVFRADIIQNIQLHSKKFGFEPEVTAKIARLKLRLHEYPISYFPRRYAEGKKITWKDGVAALFHIFRYNLWFNPEDIMNVPTKYQVKGTQWL